MGSKLGVRCLCFWQLDFRADTCKKSQLREVSPSMKNSHLSNSNTRFIISRVRQMQRKRKKNFHSPRWPETYYSNLGVHLHQSYKIEKNCLVTRETGEASWKSSLFIKEIRATEIVPVSEKRLIFFSKMRD